jgi:hypothetical protein
MTGCREILRLPRLEDVHPNLAEAVEDARALNEGVPVVGLPECCDCRRALYAATPVPAGAVTICVNCAAEQEHRPPQAGKNM